MCSTCGAAGVVGEYREHQFIVVAGVVSGSCGRLGGKYKIILKWI